MIHFHHQTAVLSLTYFSDFDKCSGYSPTYFFQTLLVEEVPILATTIPQVLIIAYHIWLF